MPLRGIVFDLDGTLVDSLTDISSALNAGLALHDIAPKSDNWVRSHLGHGAHYLVRQALSGTSAPEKEVLREFVEYYSVHPVVTTAPYPTVRDALEYFDYLNLTMGVISNKPEKITRSVLEILVMDRYFIHMWGGDTHAEKKPSPLPLRLFIEQTGIPSSELLMVGDSPADMECAAAADVLSCYFRPGYGALPSRRATPDFIIESFSQLTAIVDELRQ